MENNIKSILQEAEEIRQGSRNSDYGDAVENFKRIATKLSREAYRHKRDNLVDLCGYADIMQEVCESTDVNDGRIQN